MFGRHSFIRLQGLWYFLSFVQCAELQSHGFVLTTESTSLSLLLLTFLIAVGTIKGFFSTSWATEIRISTLSCLWLFFVMKGNQSSLDTSQEVSLQVYENSGRSEDLFSVNNVTVHGCREEEGTWAWIKQYCLQHRISHQAPWALKLAVAFVLLNFRYSTCHLS